MESSTIESPKDYLRELALRVEKIQDDVLCEELDVDSQLIRVSTSLADWKSVPLSDIHKCAGFDGGILWERCPYSDFRVGDIVETPDIHICKIDKILRNESEVDNSIMLGDGSLTTVRYGNFVQVMVSEN